MGLGTFLLLAAIGALVLVPTRRLFVAGWTSGPLATYYLGVVGLGLLVAELRGPTRFLVPLLVLAYVAPFVTFRAGIARIAGRRPPAVTPRGPIVRPGPIRRVGPPVDDPAGDVTGDHRGDGPAA